MAKPLVSFIMGSYNPRDLKILRAAVDSVLSQTWTDWELIICDDGSEEPASRALRSMAQLDPRIRCYRSEENRGLAHAMNICLCHAEGTLIARMDDDDFSEPNRIETQIRFLQEHPEYDWVGTQAWLFDEKGIWGTSSRPEIPEKRDFLKYSPYIHPSVLFRRDVLDRFGGYRESGMSSLSEDYELFMRLTAAGCHGYNLPQYLFRYRENRASIEKRSFRRSIHEAYVRWNGFRNFGILSPATIPYVIKPLAINLVAVAPHLAQKLRLHHSRDVRPLDQEKKK